MKKIILVSLILALTACTNFKNDVQTANNNVRQGFHKIGKGVKDYFNPPPETPPVIVEKPPSYCYKTLADVICYDSPQPDKEAKLVGKQVPKHMDDHALTGGDPNVSVISVQTVPSPMNTTVTSTTTTVTEMPSPGTNGGAGQAPHALMPQF